MQGQPKGEKVVRISPLDVFYAYIHKVKRFHHHHHHLMSLTPTSHKYETSGICACKHESEGCFSTALGRQTKFSDTCILNII